MRSHLLKITLAVLMTVFASLDIAAAANQTPWPAAGQQPVGATGVTELAQVNSRTTRTPDEVRERPGWRPGFRPGAMRQTYYYCSLDNGGGCPASSGRVGQRCRCGNQTGGGQLQAR